MNGSTADVRYSTIVADPPWRYDDGFSTRSHTNGIPNGPSRRYALPYPPLDVDAIAALPVADFAAPACRLFCWTTNRYLPDTFGILAAWGFRYKQTLVWAKRDGFSGSIAPNAEFLVVGVHGSPPVLDRWSSPVVSLARTREHSRKPEAFLDLIEQVSPGPYLELFARRQRLGWDTWGNEALEHVTIGST